MFDIGFWELGLITIVALVVIGPERLPGVARSVGKWVGGMQRFMSSVKRDIDSEINKHEDLKQLIDEQKELKETHEILENAASDLSEATSVPSGIGISASDTLGIDTDTTSTATEAPAPQVNSTQADTDKTGAEDKQSHG